MTTQQKNLIDTFFERALKAFEDTDSFWDKFCDWTIKIDTKWNHEFTGEIVRRINEFEKATRKNLSV